MISKLLKVAMRVIRPEIVQYKKYLGITINSIGLDIPTYADPISIKASVQAQVSQQMITQYNLDPTKNYRLVDIPANMIGTAECDSNDLLIFHSKTWNIIKVNNWHDYDGWVKLIVAENKNYTTTTPTEA